MTNNHEQPDRPPILGRWRNIYLVVMGNLALLIFLFYLITIWFS